MLLILKNLFKIIQLKIKSNNEKKNIQILFPFSEIFLDFRYSFFKISLCFFFIYNSFFFFFFFFRIILLFIFKFRKNNFIFIYDFINFR
jgi:hypothetical protein